MFDTVTDKEIVDAVFYWIDSDPIVEKRLLKDVIKYHLLHEIIAGTKCKNIVSRHYVNNFKANNAKRKILLKINTLIWNGVKIDIDI